MTAALSLAGVSKRYGGVTALAGVDLVVPEGSFFGIIGPNGAGKSSLLNAVTGFLTPDAGSVRIGKLEVQGLPPHAIERQGVARTFQNIRLFAGLSVFENLQVAAEARERGDGEVAARCDELLVRLGLDAYRNAAPASLPYGHQRRLEIGRALMTAPRILLLDEPAAGMTTPEAQALGAWLRELRDERSLTLVLVEHNMDLVMAQCDRVHVLDRGASLFEGTPAEVQAEPRVIAAYLADGSPP